jgi:hypothetical protein
LTSLGCTGRALTAYIALVDLTVAVIVLPVALLDGRSAGAERTVDANLASLTAALCKTLLLLTGAALSGASVISTGDKKARCDYQKSDAKHVHGLSFSSVPSALTHGPSFGSMEL